MWDMRVSHYLISSYTTHAHHGLFTCSFFSAPSSDVPNVFFRLVSSVIDEIIYSETPSLTIKRSSIDLFN